MTDGHLSSPQTPLCMRQPQSAHGPHADPANAPHRFHFLGASVLASTYHGGGLGGGAGM